MPFVSDKQRKACFATDGFGGKIDCHEWAKDTKMNYRGKKAKKQMGGTSLALSSMFTPRSNNTYQTQQEVDAANVLAQRLAQKNYHIDPTNVMAASKPGDRRVPFVNENGMDITGAFDLFGSKQVATSVPSSIGAQDIQSQQGIYWYNDPHTGDPVDIDPSLVNLPRFRKQLRGGMMQRGGLMYDQQLREQQLLQQQAIENMKAMQQTSYSEPLQATPIGQTPIQEGVQKGLIEQPAQYASGQEWLDYNNAPPDKKKHPATPSNWRQNLGIGMMGVRTLLGEISGRVARGRQNQYDWQQQSALGQMNPMPTDDYQPNPYSLYAKYGGKLKDYQTGGKAPIYTSDRNDPRLKAYQDSLTLHTLDLDALRTQDRYETATYNQFLRDPSGWKQGSKEFYDKLTPEKAQLDAAMRRLQIAESKSTTPNEPVWNRSSVSFQPVVGPAPNYETIPQLNPSTSALYQKPVQPVMYRNEPSVPAKKVPIKKKAIIIPPPQDSLPVMDTMSKLKAFQQGGMPDPMKMYQDRISQLPQPTPNYQGLNSWSGMTPTKDDSLTYTNNFNNALAYPNFAGNRMNQAMYTQFNAQDPVIQNMASNEVAAYKDALSQQALPGASLLRAPVSQKPMKFGGLKHSKYFGPPFSNGANYKFSDSEKYDKTIVSRRVVPQLFLRQFINKKKYAEGGIHIKLENRGKFTDYCGGEVTSDCIEKGLNSPSAVIRKRANFARNARKWNK